MTFEFQSDYNGQIHFRKPCWCKGFKVEYKNKESSSDENGYVILCKNFAKGDMVKIYLPRNLQKHIKKDDEKFIYFTYGELVLAEHLGNGNCPESDHAKGENDFTEQELIPCEKLKNTNIKKLDGLNFEVDSHTLVPFYEIVHGRYRVYFETE